METTRGVYCVDVRIVAKPISMRSKLRKIDKTLHRIPVALDGNLNPISDRFILKVISRKDIHKYTVDYHIANKKYLSGLCNS